MTPHAVDQIRNLVLRLVGIGPRPRRSGPRGRLVGAVLLVIGTLGIGLHVVGRHLGNPSRATLERTVEQVPVPGAAHPIRVDRWGSALCALHIPFCGWYPNDDILLSSGGTMTPAAYLAAWQTALTQAGWTRHTPDPNVSDGEHGWWTRDGVAVVLWLQSDQARGPVFDWADGQLLVEVHETGDGMARLPA